MRDVVLVTGAGGFVGSAVMRKLVGALRRAGVPGAVPAFSDGEPVGRVVAMLRPGGSLARLEDLQPSSAWSVVHADLEDGPAVQAMLAEVRPRVILHAGWSSAAHGALTESQRASIIDAAADHVLDAQRRTGRENREHRERHGAATGQRLDEAAAVETNPAYLAYLVWVAPAGKPAVRAAGG